jgi:hypothetical protein
VALLVIVLAPDARVTHVVSGGPTRIPALSCLPAWCSWWEVHDIVAHWLAVIARQAEGGDRRVRKCHDPEPTA